MFKQLREFLEEEETTRLAALQEESEEKKELVKKKSDSISSCILTFSHAVIAIENEIASNDALFLKARALLHTLPPKLSNNSFSVIFFLISELRKHKEKVMVIEFSAWMPDEVSGLVSHHGLELFCSGLRFLKKSQKSCQDLSSVWPNMSAPSATTSGRRWPNWSSTVSPNMTSPIRTATGNQCTGRVCGSSSSTHHPGPQHCLLLVVPHLRSDQRQQPRLSPASPRQPRTLRPLCVRAGIGGLHVRSPRLGGGSRRQDGLDARRGQGVHRQERPHFRLP